MNSFLTNLVVALTLASPLSAGNILENPSFDRGQLRWEFFVPQDSKTHGNTLTIVEDEGINGGPAVKITSPVSSRCAVGQRSIPIKPWTRYRVTFWFKADKDADHKIGPIARLDFRTNGTGDDTEFYISLGGKVDYFSKDVKRVNSLPKTWEKVEAIVESPINAKDVTVCFFSWNIVGSVYFDELCVEEIIAGAK